MNGERAWWDPWWPTQQPKLDAIHSTDWAGYVRRVPFMYDGGGEVRVPGNVDEPKKRRKKKAR